MNTGKLGGILMGVALFGAIADIGRATTINPVVTFGTNSVTQTATYSSAPTDATESQTMATFSDFQSLAVPAGSVLQSVDISMGLTVGLSSLYFTNLDGTLPASTLSFTYLAYTGFDTYGSTVSGTSGISSDLSRLSSGVATVANPVILYSLGDSPNGLTQSIGENQVMSLIGAAPTVPNGATLVSADPNNVNAYTTDNGNFDQSGNAYNPYTFSTSIASLNPSLYGGAGSFFLAYDTISHFKVGGSAGNLAFQQISSTSGTYSVTYNYIPGSTPSSGAPEPGTWVLMGTALGSLFAARKRFNS